MVAFVLVVAAGVALRGEGHDPLVRTLPLSVVLLAVKTAPGAGSGGDNVVAAGNDGNTGRVYVLDARNGQTLRSVAVPGLVTPGGDVGNSFSLLVLDARHERAVVTSFTFTNGAATASYVSVIDTRRGALVHTIVARTSPVGLATATLDTSEDRRLGGHIFVANSVNTNDPRGHSYKDSVSVIRTQDGAVERQFLAGHGVTAVAVDGRTRHVFIVTQRQDSQTNEPIGPSSVWTLDTATWRALSVVAVGQDAAPPVVDERTGRLFVYSYAGQSPYDGRVDVVDTRRGKLVRTTTVGIAPRALAVDDAPRTGASGGYVFVLNSGYDRSGSVSILDGRSGALARTVAVQGAAFAMALDKTRDHLFIYSGVNGGGANGSSRVSMMDARTGSLLSATSVGANPVALALDARDARLFVVTTGTVDPNRGDAPLGDGRVDVLDTRTGRLLRTLSVGVAPGAVAVDERVERLYAATRGGLVTTQAPDPWGWLPSWLRRRLPFLPSGGTRTRIVPPGVSVLDLTR